MSGKPDAPESVARRLPGHAPLRATGDLAAKMVAGISRYLDRATAAAVADRERLWQRDLSSHRAYVRSVSPNRKRLARYLGVVDDRRPPRMRRVTELGAGDPDLPLAEAEGYRVHHVAWDVLRDVQGEGLLLEPEGRATATVIALPDCGWTPEMLAAVVEGVPAAAQFARRLAESGCRVLVPWLINRDDEHSVLPGVAQTNQPHREFIYRPAFELGRHIIGYEVQKVLAAVDWFRAGGRRTPIAVAGYGEGGLIALHAAALDQRIAAALVSGYFGPRAELWREPLYRNVWGLLEEFGDAEVATLVAPRALVIEHSEVPPVTGPPPVREGRAGAAPGALTTPTRSAVAAEVKRARTLIEGLAPEPTIELVASPDGLPGSERALQGLLGALGMALAEDGAPAELRRPLPDAHETHARQFHQLLEDTQHLMRESEFTRKRFWARADAGSVKSWERSTRRYRDYLWDEVVGRLPEPTLPMNPRARIIYRTDSVTGYEIMLDVYEDVFAYGILMLPRDAQPGERRPVVVCQHGLEGRPSDVADPDYDEQHYHRFAFRLAEMGFVTYAPQNPYIGGDAFRLLQRKANPLRLSLFSFIARQHQRTLRWLRSLPWVDGDRIGFYGLSYGGKTAVRVPALLEDYCLSICSADYDEWIWKNCSARHQYSYLRTGEWEMPEFDLGNTFNYAELSWLICPRPFMVERGHFDGVAPDEWVAYEYARTRFRYDTLGLGERTEMEVFDGPHTINGVGTFAFLKRQLNWE